MAKATTASKTTKATQTKTPAAKAPATKTTAAKTAKTDDKKPEAEKASKPAKKVVTEDDIRARAERLWEELGKPEGQDVEIWHRAERELKG